MDSESSIGGKAKVNAAQFENMQESRHLIDEQISFHEKSILQLKYRRNELTPVSRLPPEIVGTIFTFASSASARPGSEPAFWFNFSYVCRMWRDVALATPSIWCFIPLYHQQWATAMLERSKTADLALDLQLGATPAISSRGQFMKSVLETHTSRIRELRLTGLSSSMSSSLFHTIQASRLRSLEVVGMYDQWPTFPTTVIANSEGLQALDVAMCSFAWWSMPLTGLASLKIVSNPTRPLWLDFITVLGSLLSLATLEMRDSLPLADELRLRTSKPIRFTKLRQLTLGSSKNVIEVLNVLSSIVVPQATAVKISGGIDSSKNSTSILTDISSSVSSFISQMASSKHSDAISYQTLYVECYPGKLDLEGWKGKYVETDDRCTIPADLALSITRPPDAEKLLGECTRRLPLSDLKVLGLSTDISKVVLIACFGKLQKLQGVTLCGSATLSFIEALTHKAKAKGNKRKSYYDVTFPALESLKIREAIFSPDHEGGFSFEELQDCLMERCDRNAEVRKLGLSDCYCLYEPEVDMLRELVVEVDWDEWEEEYNSEDEDEEESYPDYYSDSSSYGYGTYGDLDDWSSLI